MDPATIGIYSTIIALVGGGVIFIFKASWWLSDRFNRVTEQVNTAYRILEDKFDKRHVDNIERFAKIETKLDIVIKNGH